LKQGIGRESVTWLLEPIATALEIFGVAIIALSVLLGTVKFAVDLRRDPPKSAYNRYRANLGRGILLGLEVLVGADIIATVTSPLTWETVGFLAAIVLIRTFLSFSLETEIEGEWPWRRSSDDKAER
jgi:uncharacterized membrane protein